MCTILIHDNNAPTPSKTALENAIDANPHGCGLVWADQGTIKVWRSMAPTPAELHTLMEELRAHRYLFHARYATHGTKSIENVHPFTVGRHAAYVHNGIINGHGDERRSDTADYVYRRLAGFGGDIERAIRYASQDVKHVGGSKLAAINTDGIVRYCGSISPYRDEDGKDVPGLLTSNQSSFEDWAPTYRYLPPRPSNWKATQTTTRGDKYYMDLAIDACLITGDSWETVIARYGDAAIRQMEDGNPPESLPSFLRGLIADHELGEYAG
jgi:hypothetical protein